MFTGLVEEQGIIQAISDFDGGKEFRIEAKTVLEDLEIDHSISVNGACQTVIKIDKNSFSVQAIKETLDKTNFLDYKLGDSVNLERAMKADTRLGGHFVQGHVNGTGRFASIEKRGENNLIGIELSDDLMKYCLKEGSITLDGISLTIADMRAKHIFISIIPHSWQATNLSERKINDRLNVEVDILAKYIFQFASQMRSPK